MPTVVQRPYTPKKSSPLGRHSESASQYRKIFKNIQSSLKSQGLIKSPEDTSFSVLRYLDEMQPLSASAKQPEVLRKSLPSVKELPVSTSVEFICVTYSVCVELINLIKKQLKPGDKTVSNHLREKVFEQVFEQILYESSQLTTLDGITPTEPESTQMMSFGSSVLAMQPDIDKTLLIEYLVVLKNLIKILKMSLESYIETLRILQGREGHNDISPIESSKLDELLTSFGINTDRLKQIQFHRQLTTFPKLPDIELTSPLTYVNLITYIFQYILSYFFLCLLGEIESKEQIEVSIIQRHLKNLVFGPEKILRKVQDLTTPTVPLKTALDYLNKKIEKFELYAQNGELRAHVIKEIESIYNSIPFNDVFDVRKIHDEPYFEQSKTVDSFLIEIQSQLDNIFKTHHPISESNFIKIQREIDILFRDFYSIFDKEITFRFYSLAGAVQYVRECWGIIKGTHQSGGKLTKKRRKKRATTKNKRKRQQTLRRKKSKSKVKHSRRKRKQLPK